MTRTGALLRGRTMLCVLLLAACDDGSGPAAEQVFRAELSSTPIVGNTVISSATGSATFSWDGTRLRFELRGRGIDQLVGAHIHAPAVPGQNAAIMLNLINPAEPITTVGDAELIRGAAVEGSHLLKGVTLVQVLDALRAGRAYVLYHTARYPSGEIRGQIAAQPAP